MFRKIALTAVAIAAVTGAGVATNSSQAEAKVSLHIGVGLPGYYGGGYYGGYYPGYYRPVYHGRRCHRHKRRVKYWSNAHGHWHKRWVRGRLHCHR
jgi:hypothetical protein